MVNGRASVTEYTELLVVTKGEKGIWERHGFHCVWIFKGRRAASIRGPAYGDP